MNAAMTRNEKAVKAMTAMFAVAVVLGLGQTALAPPIANGASFFIAGPVNHNRLYWIDLPPNVRRLTARTTGGAGNISLAMNFAVVPPGMPGWGFQSHNPGNNELCVANNPAAGRWYVGTHSWPGPWGPYAGVNVRVWFQVGPTWQRAAIRSAPSVINGITRALASRRRDRDDDEDDDDDRRDDRTPGPYTPADRVRMTTLAQDQWVNGCDGEYDSRDYYRILVPSGAAALSFTTRGGSGNCMMLIRRDALPSGAQFDRRSAVAGTCQAVVIDRPRAGVYYVRLVGDPRFRDVGLRAEVETARTAAGAPITVPAATPTTAAGSPTGLSITPLTAGTGQTVTAAAGGRRYFMVHFATAPRRLAVTTRGSQGDCRLYIRRNALPTAKDYDWASTSKGADQTVILIRQLTAGTYYIMLDTTAGFSNVALLAESVATTN